MRLPFILISCPRENRNTFHFRMGTAVYTTLTDKMIMSARRNVFLAVSTCPTRSCHNIYIYIYSARGGTLQIVKTRWSWKFNQNNYRNPYPSLLIKAQTIIPDATNTEGGFVTCSTITNNHSASILVSAWQYLFADLLKFSEVSTVVPSIKNEVLDFIP